MANLEGRLFIHDYINLNIVLLPGMIRAALSFVSYL